MAKRLTPQQAAAHTLGVPENKVRELDPSKGICCQSIAGSTSLCMLDPGHPGAHRDSVHMDQQGRKWSPI
jgi:hypothetical protein